MKRGERNWEGRDNEVIENIFKKKSTIGIIKMLKEKKKENFTSMKQEKCY